MKLLRFLIVGFIFGVVLTKTEAVSWYRIFEMFHFQSFHMYGVIFTAIITGVVGIRFIKKRDLKDYKGLPIEIMDKERAKFRYIIGGTMFGIGWGIVGACPGPIFVLIGSGIATAGVILLGALVGNFIYGVLRDKLPH